MSTTLIEKLYANGDTPSGVYIRAIGGYSAAGQIRAIESSHDNSLNISPGYNSRDAFTRMRIAEPYILFTSKQIYEKDTWFWYDDLATGGTSTFTTNQAAVSLTVTTASGSLAARQSKQYINYMPGRSQLALITGIMGAKKTNVVQRIGLFDAANGFFFEQDSANLKVVRRTFTSGTAVDTAINQADWNIDKLDGTGQSGVILDMTRIQIFLIDFSWLGAGMVRFGFMINGEIIYCHSVSFSNSITTVSISNPSLPVRYEIRNTGTTASSTTLSQVCSAVFSEGGHDPLTFVSSTNLGTTGVTSAGTVPLISVRPANNRRISLLPLDYSCIALTSNVEAVLSVYIGGTITGGTYATQAVNGANVELNITGTTFSATGAFLLSTTYMGRQNRTLETQVLRTAMMAHQSLAGTNGEAITLVAQSVGGNNTQYLATLSWREIW